MKNIKEYLEDFPNSIEVDLDSTYRLLDDESILRELPTMCRNVRIPHFKSVDDINEYRNRIGSAIVNDFCGSLPYILGWDIKGSLCAPKTFQSTDFPLKLRRDIFKTTIAMPVLPNHPFGSLLENATYLGEATVSFSELYVDPTDEQIWKGIDYYIIEVAKKLSYRAGMSPNFMVIKVKSNRIAFNRICFVKRVGMSYETVFVLDAYQTLIMLFIDALTMCYALRKDVVLDVLRVFVSDEKYYTKKYSEYDFQREWETLLFLVFYGGKSSYGLGLQLSYSPYHQDMVESKYDSIFESAVRQSPNESLFIFDKNHYGCIVLCVRPSCLYEDSRIKYFVIDRSDYFSFEDGKLDVDRIHLESFTSLFWNIPMSSSARAPFILRQCSCEVREEDLKYLLEKGLSDGLSNQLHVLNSLIENSVSFFERRLKKDWNERLSR